MTRRGTSTRVSPKGDFFLATELLQLQAATFRVEMNVNKWTAA